MKLNDYFKRVSFLIFIVALFTSSGWAQPYQNVYVDVTNGSPSYTGQNPTNNPAGTGPKTSITGGLSVLANNGTLHIAAGTYNGANGSGGDLDINKTTAPGVSSSLTIKFYPLLNSIVDLQAGNVIFNIKNATLNIATENGGYLKQTGTSIQLGDASDTSYINLDAATTWQLVGATNTFNIWNISKFMTAAPQKVTNTILNYYGKGDFSAGKEAEYGTFGTGSIVINRTAGTTITFPSVAITTLGGGLTQTLGNSVFPAAVTTVGSFLQSAGTTQFAALTANGVTLNGASAAFSGNVSINNGGFTNNSANVSISGNLTFTGNSALSNAADGSINIIGNLVTKDAVNSTSNINNAGSLTVGGTLNLNSNDITNSGTGTAVFSSAVTARIRTTTVALDLPQILNTSSSSITFDQPITYTADSAADRDFTAGPTYLVENTGAGSISMSSVNLVNLGYTTVGNVTIPVRNASTAGTLTMGQIAQTNGGSDLDKAITLNFTNEIAGGTLALGGTAAGSSVGRISNVLNGTLNITNNITINGNLTNNGTAITSTVSAVDFTNTKAATTGVLTLSGAFTNSGTSCSVGGMTVDGAATNAGPLTVNGAASIAGVFTNSSTIALNANTLTLSGNTVNLTNGGTITGGVTLSNTGASSFNGGTFPSIIKTGAGTTSFITNNVVVGNLTHNAGTIAVNGIQLTAVNYVEQNTAAAFLLNAGATFKVTGDFTRTTGAFTAAETSTLLFNGNSDQNINGGTLFQVNGITFTNTGGKIYVNNSIRANGSVLISTGTTLDMATLNLILNGVKNSITNNGTYSATEGSGGGVVIGGITDFNGGQVGGLSGVGNTYQIGGDKPYSYITVDVGAGNFADVNGTVKWAGRLTLLSGTLNVTGGDLSPVGSAASIYRYPQTSPGIIQTAPGTFNASAVQYDVTYKGALTADQPVASEITQTPANVRSWTVSTTGNFSNNLPNFDLLFGGTLTISEGATVTQANAKTFTLTGNNLTHVISGKFVTALSNSFLSVTGETVSINGGTGASSIGNITIASTGSCTFTGLKNFAGTFETLANSVVKLAMAPKNNLVKGWDESIVGPTKFGGASFTITSNDLYDSLGVTQTAGLVSFGSSYLHVTAGDYIQNGGKFDSTQTGYLYFDGANANIKLASPLPYLRSTVTLTLQSDITLNGSGNSLYLTKGSTNGSIISAGFNLTAANVKSSRDAGTIFSGNGTLNLQGIFTASYPYTVSNLNINSTNLASLVSNNSSIQTLTVSGLFTMTAGSFDLGTNNLVLQSNFVRTTSTGVITATTGLLQFAGSVAQTATQGEGFSVPNLVINNSTGVTFAGSATAPKSEFTVGKSLLLTKGAFSTTVDKIMHFATGVTVTRVADVSSLSYLPTFDGTVDLVYSGIAAASASLAKEVPTAASLKVTNITIDAGTGKTISTALPFQYTGTLLLKSGSFNAAGANAMTLVGGETIQLNSGLLSVIPTVAANKVYSIIYNNGSSYTTGNEYVAVSRPNVTIQNATALTLSELKNANNVTLTSGSLELNGKSFNVYGDLNLAGGTFTNASLTSGSITFAGSALQNFMVPSGTLELNVALTVNNSGAGVKLSGGNLWLHGLENTTAPSKVDFKNGLFTVDSPNWVKLTQTPDNQGFTKANTKSYFVGKIAKDVFAGGLVAPGRFEFPIGTANNYKSAALTFNEVLTNGNTFYVSVNDTNPGAPVGFNVNASGVLVDTTADFVWTISTALGMSPSQQYDIELIGAGFPAANYPGGSVANLRLISRLGNLVSTPWVAQGGDYLNFEQVAGLPVVRLQKSTGNLISNGAQFTFGWKKAVSYYSISGKVQYASNSLQPVKDVVVKIMPGGNTVTTDSTGAFTFANLINGTYTLSATTTRPFISSAVNSSDAFYCAQNYAGTRTFSAIQTLAADVNLAGGVTNGDALLIVRRFAGLASSFAAGDWAFTSNTVNVNNTNVNTNLSALAMGDVFALTTGLPKSGSMNVVEKGIAKVSPTEEFSIPVHIDQAAELGAISLTFTYPTKYATFEGVSSNAAGLIAKDNNGIITLGWADATGGVNPLKLNAGDKMLTLKFKPTADFKINTAFKVDLDQSGTELLTKEGNSIPFVTFQVTSVVSSVPTEFALSQNYPNPFNPSTTIDYSLKSKGSVRLQIFNALGQLVNTLVNQIQDAGTYKINFNASNLASGIYFYKINVEATGESFTQIHKMILMK